jgi:hypothetical protein
VRGWPGWSLAEAPQSFETLAIALRCPPKPDAACLQRIGDQLHASHYVWGLAKHKGAGEVEAEVHLWARGKPSADATGTFPDTIKDPSDPTLRTLVSRLWDELTGATPQGTLVVRAGAGGGTVVVDGDERDELRGGTARVTVGAGEHTVAVRVPGFRAAPQVTSVASHAEREVSFTLAPVPVSVDQGAHTAPPENEGGVRAKSIVGYVAIAAGVGLLVAAGVEAAAWVSDKNASDSDRALVPNTVSDVCTYSSQAAQDACQKGKDAKTVSVLGWVFGGAGVVLAGAGTWLVVSDASRADGPHERTPQAGWRRPVQPTVRLVPEIGLRSQSLAIRVSF